jgi:hypothetical protein
MLLLAASQFPVAGTDAVTVTPDPIPTTVAVLPLRDNRGLVVLQVMVAPEEAVPLRVMSSP